MRGDGNRSSERDQDKVLLLAWPEVGSTGHPQGSVQESVAWLARGWFYGTSPSRLGFATSVSSCMHIYAYTLMALAGWQAPALAVSR